MAGLRLCPTGKRLYLTAEHAEETLREYAASERKWGEHGCPTSKYACCEGGVPHFHLSTMDQRRVGAIEMRKARERGEGECPTHEAAA